MSDARRARRGSAPPPRALSAETPPKYGSRPSATATWSPASQRRDHLRGEPRLEPDQPGQRVQPRLVDRVLRRLPRSIRSTHCTSAGPDPTAAGGPGIAATAGVVQRHQRRHHRAHPRARARQCRGSARPRPIMEFRCTPKPGTQTPDPSPRLVVIAQTLPRRSTARRSSSPRGGPAPAAPRPGRGPTPGRCSGSPGISRAGRGHRGEHVVQVVAAGEHGVPVHRGRLAGRGLDHAVGRPGPAGSPRRRSATASTAASAYSPVEGGRVLGQQLVRLVVIGVPQRVAGLQERSVRPPVHLDTRPRRRRPAATRGSSSACAAGKGCPDCLPARARPPPPTAAGPSAATGGARRPGCRAPRPSAGRSRTASPDRRRSPRSARPRSGPAAAQPGDADEEVDAADLSGPAS